MNPSIDSVRSLATASTAGDGGGSASVCPLVRSVVAAAAGAGGEDELPMAWAAKGTQLASSSSSSSSSLGGCSSSASADTMVGPGAPGALDGAPGAPDGADADNDASASASAAADPDAADPDAAFSRAYRRLGRTAHMGVLDRSYRVFASRHGRGAVVYKVKHGTLVVTGDPLCAPEHWAALLAELRRFRRARGLRLAFLNVGDAFADYARRQGWATLHFGRERVLNPLTNAVLARCKGGAGRRILSQNRQLLRAGVALAVYAPGLEGPDAAREAELQGLYDAWRRERNLGHGRGRGRGPGNGHGHGPAYPPANAQAFVTVYDLFSRPDATLFLSAAGPDGRALGFAALRSLGAHAGFQLDPCVAAPAAPRGVTDLLVVAAMTLLRRAGVAYLSLGFEPLPDLGAVSGPLRSGLAGLLARRGYRRVMRSVPLAGKKTYNDKFRPDDALASNLYIVLPAAALMHVANIKIRRLLPMRIRRSGP